jgi:hypothetical protein
MDYYANNSREKCVWCASAGVVKYLEEGYYKLRQVHLTD